MILFKKYIIYIEISEPKWVNPVLKSIGVNTLRVRGLHIIPRIYGLKDGDNLVTNQRIVLDWSCITQKFSNEMEVSEPKWVNPI